MGEPTLLELFVASSIPVLKILLICSVGAFCARKGLLTAEGRRVLGALSFLVFNPALNFVKLASTLTPTRLLHWWPLVLNTGISTAVGLGIGWLGVRLVRPVPYLRPHTVVAIALGNVGNLPLVIVSTLASSSAAVLHGIPPDRAGDLAVGYVVVGLLIPCIAHATIGFSMLRKPDAETAMAMEVTPAGSGGSNPSDHNHLPHSGFPGADSEDTTPGPTAHLQPISNLSATSLANTTSAPMSCSTAVVPLLLPAPSSTSSSTAYGASSSASLSASGGLGLGHRRRHPQRREVETAPLLAAQERSSDVVTPLPYDSAGSSSSYPSGTPARIPRSLSLPSPQPLPSQPPLSQPLPLPPSLPSPPLPKPQAPAAASLLGNRGVEDVHGDHDKFEHDDQEISAHHRKGDDGSIVSTILHNPYAGGGGCSGGGAGGSAPSTEGPAASTVGPATSIPGSGTGCATCCSSTLLAGKAAGAAAGGGGSDPLDIGSQWQKAVEAGCPLGIGPGGFPSTFGAGGCSGPYVRSSSSSPACRVEMELTERTPLLQQQPPTTTLTVTTAQGFGSGRAHHHRQLQLQQVSEVGRLGEDTSRKGDTELGCCPGGGAGGCEGRGGSAHDQPLKSQSPQLGAPSTSTSATHLTHANPAHHTLRALARTLWKEVTSPPLLAILLSVPVGCIRPLQRALFEPGAPLALVGSCLAMLGDCTVPTILILLGATLANGPGAAYVPLRVTALVSTTRLLLLPLLGLGLVMGAYAARIFEAPDPIYLLVLLIQNTAPTAIMVHTMASVQCNCAEEVSSILFWGYMAGILVIPLWLTTFLFVVQRSFRSPD